MVPWQPSLAFGQPAAVALVRCVPVLPSTLASARNEAQPSVRPGFNGTAVDCLIACAHLVGFAECTALVGAILRRAVEHLNRVLQHGAVLKAARIWPFFLVAPTAKRQTNRPKNQYPPHDHQCRSGCVLTATGVQGGA